MNTYRLDEDLISRAMGLNRTKNYQLMLYTLSVLVESVLIYHTFNDFCWSCNSRHIVTLIPNIS